MEKGGFLWEVSEMKNSLQASSEEETALHIFSSKRLVSVFFFLAKENGTSGQIRSWHQRRL